MANYFVKPTATGANNGTSWTDAWTNIQSAFDTVTSGNDVFCQGTQTLTVQIDVDTNTGTTAAPIRFFGVNTNESATPLNDVDGTLFTLDGNSASVDCLAFTSPDYLRFTNVSCINATVNGWDFGGQLGLQLWGCRGNSNAGGDGFEFISEYGASVIQCQANNNSVAGFTQYTTGAAMVLCEAISNGSSGFNPGTGGISIFCVSHNTTGIGITLTTGSNATYFCVSDGNSTYGITAIASTSAYFNRLTNNTTGGMNLSAVAPSVGFNAFYNNGVKTSSAALYALSNLPGSDIDMASDGYVNRAADNFALTDIAEFRRRALNVGSYSV